MALVSQGLWLRSNSQRSEQIKFAVVVNGILLALILAGGSSVNGDFARLGFDANAGINFIAEGESSDRGMATTNHDIAQLANLHDRRAIGATVGANRGTDDRAALGIHCREQERRIVGSGDADFNVPRGIVGNFGEVATSLGNHVGGLALHLGHNHQNLVSRDRRALLGGGGGGLLGGGFGHLIGRLFGCGLGISRFDSGGFGAGQRGISLTTNES